MKQPVERRLAAILAPGLPASGTPIRTSPRSQTSDPSARASTPSATLGMRGHSSSDWDAGHGAVRREGLKYLG